MSARVVIDGRNRRVVTTFADGSEVVATPPYGDEEAIARAKALGYPAKRLSGICPVWMMTKDHDRLHTLLAEAQGYPVSLALWFAAHPDLEMRAADRVMASLEERTVLLVQRLLNEGLEVVWSEREASQDQEKAA